MGFDVDSFADFRFSDTAKAVNMGSKGDAGASPAPTEVHKSGLSIMLASSLSS